MELDIILQSRYRRPDCVSPQALYKIVMGDENSPIWRAAWATRTRYWTKAQLAEISDRTTCCQRCVYCITCDQAWRRRDLTPGVNGRSAAALPALRLIRVLLQYKHCFRLEW